MFNTKIYIKSQIVIVMALIMPLVGCSKQPVGILNHIPPPYVTYSFLLNLQDPLGVELLDNLPIDNDGKRLIDSIDLAGDNSSFFFPVKTDCYSCYAFVPDSFSQKYLSMSRIDSSRVLYGLSRLSNNDYHSYLYFEERNRSYSWAEMLTYKLTCPDLFGDKKEHTILSYWEPRLTGHFFYKSNPLIYDCSRITIDGREYPVSLEKDTEGSLEYMRIYGFISVAWGTIE